MDRPKDSFIEAVMLIMLICACRQKHILCILDARWHSMIPQQLNRNKGMHRDGNNILQSLHDSA